MRLLAGLLVFAGLAAAQAPDCAIAPGFKQDGEAREFNTETLYNYMDGNSEGYFLYNFVLMRGVTCKNGALSLVLDVSEFQDDELAYGMFTSNVDARLPRANLGAAGQVTAAKAIFVKGKYFVEISMEPQGDHAAALEAAAKAMEPRVPGSVSAPKELNLFPKEGLQPGSPRLIPQSVLGLRMLKRGYLGVYGNGRLFFVSEASPDAAKALFEKLKARFAPAGPAQAGEEAYTGDDRLLGKFCLFRKGARVGGFVSAIEGADPAKLAAAFAAGLH
ncbi:MAG: hypothetical protein P4K98_02700 [Bryobacteraceae bacterium]|nr:hypothetical protein [Bryobacteraceae bacterium]